jgi:hypothetical protein
MKTLARLLNRYSLAIIFGVCFGMMLIMICAILNGEVIHPIMILSNAGLAVLCVTFRYRNPHLLEEDRDLR